MDLGKAHYESQRRMEENKISCSALDFGTSGAEPWVLLTLCY